MLFLLLPPSEGKAVGGAGRWQPTSGTFGRRLGTIRRAVIDALGRTTVNEAKLGAKGALFDRATAANDAVATDRARRLPAHQRYTGVVWEHLGATTLDDEQRKRILVPSALLGLVTANDPVPDHRLKFDVALDGVGRLDRFWRPHLTEALEKHTSRHDTIVELLPQEHTAAIDLDAVAKRRHLVHTTVVGVSGHDAKAVKGALALHLLARDHVDANHPFDWHGWRADYDDDTRTLTVSR